MRSLSGKALFGTVLAVGLMAVVYLIGFQARTVQAQIGLLDNDPHSYGGRIQFKGPVLVDGVLTDRALAKFTAGRVLIHANRAVELTSPATVVTVLSTDDQITLTSDANLTGITLAGGTLNQVVHIVSGAGSNTQRLDDATSMTVGTNITLTEGQHDSVDLECWSADGDDWMAVAAHDN